MRKSLLAQLVVEAAETNIKLYDWQKKWLDDNSRFRIMLKSRAVGGSFLIALESFLDSLLNPNFTILLVSFSMRQSLELFRKVKEHINRWKGIRIRVGDDVYTFNATLSETKTQVEFENGSRIVSLPNNPDAIRGFRADHVYVDEAAMFKNDFEIKAAIIPTIAGKEGRLSLISTPKGKRGWFYEAWMSETFSKHKVHYSMAPHITESDLEGMKASMTPLEWAQEMEMEFLDELNALFPYEMILACAEDYSLIIPDEYKTNNPVFIGIDFGRYRDSTVITVLEKIDQGMKVIFLKEFLGVDMAEQLEYIKMLIKALKPAKVLIDKTGLGIPMHDFLSREYPEVEGVTFTAASKEAMILNLYNHMRAKRVTIPVDAAELISQLRQFQRVQEKSGRVKYEAPPNAYDDYVISLALAAWAASRPFDRIMVTPVWKW
jgi:phage FluMu gp28-like protein